VTMSAGLRKLVLTAHVTTSVGWVGAVAAYLALDVTAASSHDIEVVRGAYVAMQILVAAVIVPLALATVVIGVVNALGTPWGLLRHYWVLAKLLLTVLATAVLLLEAPTVDAMARVARSPADPRDLPGSLPHSIGGLVVLLAVTALSIYKPRGTTRYGWRKQRARLRVSAD
jgi:hypothetical protein